MTHTLGWCDNRIEMILEEIRLKNAGIIGLRPMPILLRELRDWYDARNEAVKEYA